MVIRVICNRHYTALKISEYKTTPYPIDDTNLLASRVLELLKDVFLSARNKVQIW